MEDIRYIFVHVSCTFCKICSVKSQRQENSSFAKIVSPVSIHFMTVLLVVLWFQVLLLVGLLIRGLVFAKLIHVFC